MTDISHTDIRLMDGTLLLVFLGLMQHRKATAVAAELGLTQPAISHALKRLRALYGDALFLRKSQGLEPTALAREIEPEIRDALRLLSGSLAHTSSFDPGSSQISLRIAGLDYELATLVPPLIARASRIGPQIMINSLSTSPEAAMEALAQSRIDLAIGFFEDMAGPRGTAAFRSHDLYTETFVVTGRHDHPLFRQAITLEAYAAAPHLLISPAGVVRGSVDYALEALGTQRTVRATVPQFFPALALLGQSDLIATLPRKVAETFGARFGLRHAALPFRSPNPVVRALWHRRDAQSPVQEWLLGLLAEVIDQAATRTAQ